MSTIAAAVRELMALGVNGEALVAAIERIEAASAGPMESSEDRKRRISRETSARHRASRNVTETSPDVTGSGVTKRHETSPGDTNVSPLARVVDINPSTVLTGIISSSIKTRDVSDWKNMLIQARDAAGEDGDFTRPAMLHAGDLRQLIQPLTGEPCSWDEVLTAIAMTCARQRARGKKLTTWAWVRDDAISLRDKRLNAHMPAPQAIVARPQFTSASERAAENRKEAMRLFLAGETDEAANH